MSTLYVDNLVEKSSNHGVHIPGHQVQIAHGLNSQSNISPTASNTWNVVNYSSPLEVSITPKFANSLIRAEMFVNVLVNNVNYAGAGLRRDSTDIGYFWGYNAVGNWMPWSPSICVIDQPNTTNTVTYKPIINMSGSTLSNYLWNYQGPVASLPLRATRIILTEIAQ